MIMCVRVCVWLVGGMIGAGVRTTRERLSMQLRQLIYIRIHYNAIVFIVLLQWKWAA